MTQIASLLAVATVFVGLWTLNIYILMSGRGELICETKLPMQELELKIQGGGGGLCTRVGVIAGFYDIYTVTSYPSLWKTEIEAVISSFIGDDEDDNDLCIPLLCHRKY